MRKGKDKKVMISSSKKITPKTSHTTFAEFIWIWNHSQDLSFPPHHKIIAKWLEAQFFAPAPAHKNAFLLAFRGSGKSTLTGLFCAYLLWQDSSLRILIMAADFELAKKMVRNTKRIIEKHPLTLSLVPKDKSEWASDRFTIARKIELRDPSVLAKGLGANITGCRADIIICDDVEVPKTCNTPFKRKELRARLSELDFILTPQGMILYLGTPHTFYTIYSVKDTPENPAFLKGYNHLRFPIVDSQGTPAWTERFPPAKIAELRRKSGPNKFAGQMLLTPVNYSEGRLNIDRLKTYTDELVYEERNLTATLSIGAETMLSASAWWDPAWGKKQGSDSSVVACVFTGADGLYRLHRIKYLSCGKGAENHGETEDEATAQVMEVIDFIRTNHLPALHLETNGLGKFLPSILRKKLREEGVHCGVIENISHTPKATRIMEAFDAPLADRALLVHESVLQTPFAREMREWTPLSPTHDDGLDAVAGCLLSEPVRMPKNFAQLPIKGSAKSWRAGGENFFARTDFNL